jgi:hypothetical protein
MNPIELLLEEIYAGLKECFETLAIKFKRPKKHGKKAKKIKK